MLTEEVFRSDSYLTECEATVVSINALGGIVLDRTNFYPTGGGQPGDTGILRLADGSEITIATTVKGKGDENVVHVPAEGQTAPSPGSQVTAVVDWDRRYLHMQMHTALHLVCSVVPAGVTGNQIGAKKSRMDFDMGDEKLDKEEIAASVNALIDADHPTYIDYITDEELDAQPEIIPTMSVAPPRGTGRIRLLKIGEIDLQPCGGTHVSRTGEIGHIRATKIESKGKRNRRVSIAFAD
ncbi:MAG: alanyl-tRNA editing protein [Alphaproteobacteria bacterium]|jgi:misacylated tRNA(Ala) deacylase|nr:alanyl-tRNA editing protein [Alphaproteobacteria bacterium]